MLLSKCWMCESPLFAKMLKILKEDMLMFCFLLTKECISEYIHKYNRYKCVYHYQYVCVFNVHECSHSQQVSYTVYNRATHHSHSGYLQEHSDTQNHSPQNHISEQYNIDQLSE